MKLLILFLLAVAAWGQPTVSSHSEVCGDNDCHVTITLSGTPASAPKLRWSATTFSDCTTGTVQLTPTSAGSTGTTQRFILIGLNQNTQYFWAVCVGSTMLTGGSPPYTVTTSNTASSHPVAPTEPDVSEVYDGNVPTSWATDVATSADCSDLGTKISDAAAAGAGNHRIRTPVGQNCPNISYPSVAADRKIFIISDRITRLPPDHARIIPEFDEQHMFRFAPTTSQSAFAPASATSRGARLVGAYVPTATGDHTAELVTFRSSSNICDDCAIDRSIITGRLQTSNNRRLVVLRSKNAVRNSFLQTSGTNLIEAIAITADSSSKSLVQNNHIKGTTYSLFFQGNELPTCNTDILAKQNLFEGDERQRQGSATNTPSNTYYTQRHALEAKCAQKMKIIGNIFKDFWRGGLVGGISPTISLQPIDNYTATVVNALNDIQIESNVFGRVASPINIGNETSTPGAQHASNRRIAVRNNLAVNIDSLYGTTFDSSEDRSPFITIGCGSDYVIEGNVWYSLNSTFAGPMLNVQRGPCGGNSRLNNNIGIHKDVSGIFGGMFRWAPVAAGTDWYLNATTPTDDKDRFTQSQIEARNNIVRAVSPDTKAAIESTLPTTTLVPGDDAAGLAAIGFKNGSTTSVNPEDFCLNVFTSQYRASSTEGRAQYNCIAALEAVGGVSNFSVQGITATTITVGFRAPGGLTGPGTACQGDVNTSATFANEPSRETATVHSAIPWYQTIVFDGLTTGTNYYIRLHCAGEPFVYGSVASPTVVRTR